MPAINAHVYSIGSEMPAFVPHALRNNPVTVFNSRFNIRREDAGFVIGSKGFKLKRFMRDTGAHIELAHSPNESFFYIQALSYQSVHTALALIETEARKAFDLNTGRRQKTEPRKHYQLTIPIVSATAGLLIGKGGSTCRGIKQKLGLAGLRIDTNDGVTTLRVSGNDLKHCQMAIAQLQVDFPTVFFSAPPAPRKMAPQRSSPPSHPPPTRPPPLDLGGEVGGGSVRPVSPIDLYLPGGAGGPRTPDGPPPRTPDDPHTPPFSPRTPDGPPPRTPDETPPDSSWRGIPEEQVRMECLVADKMLEFFTAAN